MDKMGVREFRYLLPAGDAFTTGTVTVTIAAGAVKNADTTDASGATVTGAQNITTTDMFAVEGPTAELTNPGNGGTIDINVVNGRNWIDVTFDEPTCTTAPCMTINQNSITSLTPKFTLGGAGLGTLALDSTQAPVLIGNTPTTLTYRFWLTGEAANTSTAPVTLTFLANSWSYYLPSLPALPSVTVGVTSSGGAFVGPVTVQITIPDAADTGHTDPLLTGFNVDPTSLVLKDLTFTTTTTGWSVVIDPTRAITLVAGTTDEFNIPVLVTLPGTGLSATSSAVFDVAFQNATDIAYFGNPGGATQSGTNGGNTYTAASFPSNRSYVDVAFSPASGQTLVSVPSPGNGQITLSGSGLNGVSFASGSPMALGGGVYRYLLTGSFVAGTVTVTVAAGAVTSNGARGPPGHQTTVTDSSLQTTMSFTVQGPTADVVVTDPITGTVTSLAGGSIGRSVINGTGYIEISFHATSGNTIDPATITGNEIQVRDANGNLLTLSGSPIRVGTTSIWQYAFTGSLADGTYTVTFIAGSFGDTSGNTNQAASETFTVSEATTTLTAPPTGGVENQADLNGRGWVDVTFPTVNGSAVLASSITSGTALFTLTDAAGDNLVIDGSPVLIDVGTSTYRFFFTGDESATAASQLTLTFTAGSWQDANGDPDHLGQLPQLEPVHDHPGHLDRHHPEPDRGRDGQHRLVHRRPGHAERPRRRHRSAAHRPQRGHPDRQPRRQRVPGPA